MTTDLPARPAESRPSGQTTERLVRSGRIEIVRLPAEVDLVSSSAVRDDLLSSVNLGEHVIVDATATTFCDSSAVNALVRARERAERLGTSLHVVTRSRPVLRVLEITQLTRVIAVVPAMHEALACIADGQPGHSCGAVDG